MANGTRAATLSPEAMKALGEFNELSVAHKTFVSQYEENRRSYEADLSHVDISESDWWDTLAPPFSEHIIETTISSMLDEEFRFRIRPKAKMFQSPEELKAAEDAAKSFQILTDMQLKLDHFDEKQRPLVLQERLAGVSPMKVYWRSEGRKRWRTTWKEDELTKQPVWERVEEDQALRDGPCAEVCDVRDFFWDDQATSLESCSIVAHRTWPTWEECKRMQDIGRWKNVDELRKERDLSNSLAERDKSGDPDKKRGRLEVIEIWRREDNGSIRVYTIGERDVLLAEYDNPFDHGEFPFVLFVGQSKPFRIPGRAQIEKLADLQSALWVVMNQRFQNLILLNNGVIIYNEDLVDDLDGMDIYPGAQWAAHGDAAAAYQSWNPNPTPAQISIPAESMIKGDMQNLGGGFPFTTTGEAQNVNASTATEASLTASLAQRSIIEAKRHLYECYRRVGQMFLELNQQFTREPVYALVVGADDALEQKEILPQILEGDWVFDIEPMTESLMRQERRSEMLSLFQAVMPSVQIGAMTGALVNTKRLYELLFESYDIRDIEGMFMAPPPAQGAQGALPPGAPQEGGVPGMGTPPAANGNGGTTNASLAAGPLAPSNPMSMAGGQMMQQFQADQTPRNV